MPSIVTQILKFLASAFGFVIKARVENARTKGLEAQNAILKADQAKGDRTAAIIKETIKVEGEDELPSFDYSNFR